MTKFDQAIYVSGLNVSFGAFSVLKNLSWLVNFGEVKGVIGPNGAGKTTLLDALTGKTEYQTGDIVVRGHHNIKDANEPAIARLGLGRKFQKPSIFSGLSVFENLEIALRSGKAVLQSIKQLTPLEQDKIDETAILIGLADCLEKDAGTLAHGQKQWLEIGMLIVANPAVLLLDEPVAGMNGEERTKTAALIDKLKGSEMAIVVVEHDMQFVETVCDSVTVLHDGQILVEGPMQAVKANQQVIDVYLGRDSENA